MSLEQNLKDELIGKRKKDLAKKKINSLMDFGLTNIKNMIQYVKGDLNA